MATYRVSTTTTSATFTVTGVKSGDSIRIYVRLTSETLGFYDNTFTSTGTTFTKTVTGLTEGTSYTANVSVNDVILGATEFVTDANPRPDPWSWNSIYSGAPITNLSATEWRNFLGFINSVRNYKELGTYSFPWNPDRGDDITAEMFNAARTAISQISGHGTLPNTVYSGSPVYASYFTRLASAVNAAL